MANALLHLSDWIEPDTGPVQAIGGGEMANFGAITDLRKRPWNTGRIEE